MKDAFKKQALAKVFGIVRRDGVLMGVPVIPGLREKIISTNDTVKTVKGLPVQFEQYMTDEQKTEFKTLIGYKSRKRISQIPQDIVTNEG